VNNFHEKTSCNTENISRGEQDVLERAASSLAGNSMIVAALVHDLGIPAGTASVGADGAEMKPFASKHVKRS